MKFTDLMKFKKDKNEQQIREIYKDIGMGEEELPRMTEHIELREGLRLSLQASYNHHCTPQITTDYENYETMEFALLSSAGFVDVSVEYPNMSILSDLKEYADCSPVYHYVPVELIEKMCEEMGLI